MAGEDNPFSAPSGPVPAADAPGVYGGRFRGHRLHYWIQGEELHVDEGLLRIVVPLTHPEVRLIERRFAAPSGYVGMLLIAIAAVSTALAAGRQEMTVQPLALGVFGVFLVVSGIGARVAVGSRRRHIIIRVLDGDRARFEEFVRQVKERIRPGG